MYIHFAITVGHQRCSRQLYLCCLYLAQGLQEDQEGLYKCCLPTNCSDPNTNIITANVFSKISNYYDIIRIYCTEFAQISFYVDLPTDMTVYPQEYTLHCVKTGFDNYDITVSFQSDVVVVQGTGCTHYKPCNGIELHFRNKT